MGDFLIEIGRNKVARQFIKRLKLPLTLPEELKRDEGPYSEHPLQGQVIGIGGDRKAKAHLLDMLKAMIINAGGQTANVYGSGASLNALVFDATEALTVQDLGLLYDFIKPRLQGLNPNGRVVLIGLTPDFVDNPERAAISGALLGFGKSLAKELGRKGITVQIIYTSHAAFTPDRLTWPLIFVLSARSAYISGQPIYLSHLIETGLTPAFKNSLSGKTALVTGAAHGIGREICRRLGQEGAKIIGLDRPAERDQLTATMDEIGGAPYFYDLLDPHAPMQIARSLERDIGSIDILVSNAGLTRDKTLARMPRDYWDDALNLNLKAPMELIGSLVIKGDTPLNLLAPGGRLIFLSSVSGIAGNAGQTNYAAAKSGLIAFSEALAHKIAPHGITVNAIAPGFIDTRMTQAMPTTIREIARRLNALGQAGLPSDIAEAVVFLASPGSFAITGQTMRVCGLSMIGA